MRLVRKLCKEMKDKNLCSERKKELKVGKEKRS